MSNKRDNLNFKSLPVIRSLYIAALVLSGLILVGIAYIGNQTIGQHYQEQVEADTQRQLNQIYTQIHTNLHSLMQTIKGVPALFAVNPELSQADFELGVKHLISADSQIRNIAAAPDYVIRYMYPIDGNEKAIGLNYMETADQIGAVLRAVETQQVVIAGPQELVQGGAGMIARLPVFINGEKDEQHFWGIVSAVFDMKQFYLNSGLESELPIKVAIRGMDGLGHDGDVFFGDPRLFDNPRLQQTINLAQGKWIIAAEPYNGWQNTEIQIWWDKLIYSGALFILYLVIALFLYINFKATLANVKFRRLINSSPIPSILLTKNNQVTSVNQAFTDIYGYEVDDFIGMSSWWLITHAESETVRQFEDIAFTTGKAQQTQSSVTSQFEVVVKCRSGVKKTVLLSTSSLAEGTRNQVIVYLYDITQQKQVEEQLRISSRVFENSHEGIMITKMDSTIIDVNPAFCRITGYNRDEVLGQRTSILKSGLQSSEFYQQMWLSLAENGFWQGEIWNKHKNGDLFAEMLTISVLITDNGERHYLGLFTDITQNKKQQETLELMAHYDVLTKLPNRILFADRFSQAVSHSQSTNTMLAICFLDLDGFKPVNDEYGHEVGDQLLIEVANRLKQTVRNEDTISRFGGDEFAILFRDIGSEVECEQLLLKLHDVLAKPYVVGSHVLKITASSGVTFYSQGGTDLDTLLRHADQSMYQAKLAGRNTYNFFNASQNEKVIEHQNSIERVHQGLLNGEFRLYYQPKVNMQSGDVIGMEALIRWQHPEQGLLSPFNFLPQIEGSAVDIEVGKWVIKTALSQLELWHKAGFMIEVSVNISSCHLQSESFIDDIAEALEHYPEIISYFLQLEIVETSALLDVMMVSRVLKEARDKLGVSIALDDFGTGYSSLTHLRHLNAATIKVDQSFIRDMLDDPQDYSIVDGVVGLAESFNLSVIAEGVETQQHGAMLLLMGCKYAQGYGISKPMPSESVIDWLQNYQPDQKWMKLANERLSYNQQALKLLELMWQRWHQQFIQCIEFGLGTSVSWPIMAVDKSHCAVWIKREESLSRLDKAWLLEIEAVFFEYHQLAKNIKQKSDAATAMEKELVKFNELYRHASNLITQAYTLSLSGSVDNISKIN